MKEMGNQARVWGFKRSVVGAKPSYVAKEDPRSVDRQAPTCDEEGGRRSRMGADKSGTLAGQMKSSIDVATRKKARRCTGCTIVRHGWKSETRSQRDCGDGSKEQTRLMRIGSGEVAASSEWTSLEKKLLNRLKMGI